MPTDPLRALTLHRVWAGMVALGWKPFEFRNARPHACIGQRVAIHAGHKVGDRDAFMALAKRWPSHVRRKSPENAYEWCIDDAPGGHIIAMATVGVPTLLGAPPATGWPAEDSADVMHARRHMPPGYEGARWAIPLRDVRRLSKPVPCRGSVTLGWRVPDDVAELVRGR